MRSWGEGSAGCGLRQSLDEPLQRRGWQNEYVTDFRPIPDWEFGGPDQYLVYWRRIPEGSDAAGEWARLNDRLRQYERGIDPYRDVMNDGYPGAP